MNEHYIEKKEKKEDKLNEVAMNIHSIRDSYLVSDV